MNPKFEVIWSITAESDLLNIVEYIALDSRSTALKTLKSIKTKAKSFYQNPLRGRIIPELQSQGINHYRELIIKPWRVMYKVTENKVYVLSVIDSRQNLEDTLLKRLTK